MVAKWVKGMVLKPIELITYEDLRPNTRLCELHGGIYGVTSRAV